MSLFVESLRLGIQIPERRQNRCQGEENEKASLLDKRRLKVEPFGNDLMMGTEERNSVSGIESLVPTNISHCRSQGSQAHQKKVGLSDAENYSCSHLLCSI